MHVIKKGRQLMRRNFLGAAVGLSAVLVALAMAGCSYGSPNAVKSNSSSGAASTGSNSPVKTLPVYTQLEKGAAKTKPSSGKSLTIAFVSGGIGDPFYSAMRCGAAKAAHDYNIQLVWQGTQDTATAAVLQVLNGVMVRNPNGLMFEPFDTKGEVGPIRTIVQNGTPTVIVDGSLAQNIGLQNPHTNSLAAGRAAGEAMGKAIGKGGTVGIVSDTPSNNVQVQRYQGFEAGLKDANPTAKVLPIAYDQQDTTKAASTVSAWITAHPDLKGVYATNGPMGTGAASAVKGANKKSQILVYSYDTEPNQVSALRRGDEDALVGQSPATDGYHSVALLAQVLRHQIRPSAIQYEVYAPFKIITRQNVNSAAAKPFLYGSSC